MRLHQHTGDLASALLLFAPAPALGCVVRRRRPNRTRRIGGAGMPFACAGRRPVHTAMRQHRKPEVLMGLGELYLGRRPATNSSRRPPIALADRLIAGRRLPVAGCWSLSGHRGSQLRLVVADPCVTTLYAPTHQIPERLKSFMAGGGVVGDNPVGPLLIGQ